MLLKATDVLWLYGDQGVANKIKTYIFIVVSLLKKHNSKVAEEEGGAKVIDMYFRR